MWEGCPFPLVGKCLKDSLSNDELWHVSSMFCILFVILRKKKTIFIRQIIRYYEVQILTPQIKSLAEYSLNKCFV